LRKSSWAATLIGIDLGKRCFFLLARDLNAHKVWRKRATYARLLAAVDGLLSLSTITMKACAGANWLTHKRLTFGHEFARLRRSLCAPLRRAARRVSSPPGGWLQALLRRRHSNVVARARAKGGE
jgi:hypothetical protein